MMALSLDTPWLLVDFEITNYANAAAISWCTYSASAIFVAVLQLTEMRALVAYPVGLFCISIPFCSDPRLGVCGDDNL